MQLQFNITFRRGNKVVGVIKGNEIPESVSKNLTVGEMVEKVQETEQFLERLTGCRVHIEQQL